MNKATHLRLPRDLSAEVGIVSPSLAPAPQDIWTATQPSKAKDNVTGEACACSLTIKSLAETVSCYEAACGSQPLENRVQIGETICLDVDKVNRK